MRVFMLMGSHTLPITQGLCMWGVWESRPPGEHRDTHLITGGRVYFCSQRLRFGLGGKEVLCFVEAEAQDLSI